MNDLPSLMLEAWKFCLLNSKQKLSEKSLVRTMPLKWRFQYITKINFVLSRLNLIQRHRYKLLSKLFERPITSLLELTYPEAHAFVHMFYIDKSATKLNIPGVQWLKTL